ncbi:MAG: AMP-binding protein [Oscillospiraceae bacterium]|jgi:acetyl-CoA synthetase|nr:AMP-binding protein [Oscillospiraceae bacterium]
MAERFLDRFCRSDFSSYEEFYREYRVTYPENFNFGYDVVDELAARTPDKTALVWCNDQGDERILTFADVKRGSDAYAWVLRGLGIGRGDAVMVMLKRRYEYWLFAVAAAKVGALLIPATHMLTAKDVKYRVQAADIKMILTINNERLCGEIDGAQKDCGEILRVKAVLSGEREGYVSFGRLAEAAEGKPWKRPAGAEAIDSRGIMLAYFTSGTTGMPKIVAHDFFYPLSHITTAAFWHDLRPDDLHLTVADTGWAKAAWGKIYGQWICEAALFVYDYDANFHPSDFLDLVDKYQITSFCAPPTIYRFLIKEDLSRFSLKSLRKCTTAGEPLNPEVYQQWLKATDIRLREGFGQTESTILAAVTPWVEPRPGSMGKPMPGVCCGIYDETGRPCDPGEEGELCVPVPDEKNFPLGIFRGYYRDPEVTGSVVFDGLYHTGDIAWKDEDGYFWFKGRGDDIIKCSGYRIGPFEVESALLEHPAVLETAITGVPDPVRGLNVKATIVLTEGYEPSEALKKELQDHVKRVTAPYKYPRVIEFVDELPKTISGKIRRKEIRTNDAKAAEENQS